LAMLRIAFLPALALFLATLSACDRSNGLHRVEVKGNATYEGAPIERGLITFRPAPGSQGPAAGTGIVDGKFSIPVERGPTIGPHEVEIKIVSVATKSAESSDSALANRGPQSLKSFTESVQVSDGVNEFDFRLPPASPATNAGNK
jgi:hypothetical protein